MKHAPEQTDTITLDDVALIITYKVNRDRPNDEPPEIYDVAFTLEPAKWLDRAVHEALVDLVWDREIKEQTERLKARADGPEYDPDDAERRAERLARLDQ